MCTVNVKGLKRNVIILTITHYCSAYTLYIIIPHGNGPGMLTVHGVYKDSLISSDIYPVKSDRRCEAIVTFCTEAHTYIDNYTSLFTDRIKLQSFS